MVLTSKERSARYRARQKAKDENYTKLESAKRKARRQRKKEEDEKPTPELCLKVQKKLDEMKTRQDLNPLTNIQQLNRVKSVYKKLYGKTFDCKDFTFLKNHEQIIENIKNLKVKQNTKNAYLQGISVVLKSLGPRYKKLYKIYSEESTLQTNTLKTKTDMNLKDEKFVEWKTIKDLWDVENTEDRALMGLYLLQPPRRLEYKTLIYKGDETKDNTYSKGILTINNYKTKKTYGFYTTKLPVELEKALNKYIKEKKIKKGERLFQMKNFGQKLTNTFKKYYKEQKISANVLRHSYISWFLSTRPTIAHRKQIAMMMGHDISTQTTYDRV